MGAIGEALERYCSSQYSPGSLIQATAGQLGEQGIRPQDFVLYSERQYASEAFRYQQPDDQKAIAWAQAYELPMRVPVLAAASLIYLNYTGERGAEYFTPPTSNATATLAMYSL